MSLQYRNSHAIIKIGIVNVKANVVTGSKTLPTSKRHGRIDGVSCITAQGQKYSSYGRC